MVGGTLAKLLLGGLNAEILPERNLWKRNNDTKDELSEGR